MQESLHYQSLIKYFSICVKLLIWFLIHCLICTKEGSAESFVFKRCFTLTKWLSILVITVFSNSIFWGIGKIIVFCQWFRWYWICSLYKSLEWISGRLFIGLFLKNVQTEGRGSGISENPLLRKGRKDQKSIFFSDALYHNHCQEFYQKTCPNLLQKLLNDTDWPDEWKNNCVNHVCLHAKLNSRRWWSIPQYK